MTNTGAQPMTGEVVVQDTLPAGVIAHAVHFFWDTNPLNEARALPLETSSGSELGGWPSGELIDTARSKAPLRR